MALKAKLSKDEHAGLPDAIKELYAASGDAFVLEVEGLVGRDALEAERKARANAARDFQQLKDKIGDLDPAAAREALAKVRELSDKKLLDEGKVDELIKTRTDAMQQDHLNQVNAFKGQIQEKDERIGSLTGAVKKLRISSDLMPLALKKGARPEALDDVVARMTVTGIDGIKWDVEGEEIVAKIGDQVKYGKDPQRSMSVEEGLDLLLARAGHLFVPSSGAGASNARQSGGGSAYVISDADAHDPAKYRAAKDAAVKAGQELVIQ